jgi:zinc/manganese transport system substrate-binding protein
MVSRRFVVGLAAALCLSLAQAPAQAQEKRVKAVASFSILADLVRAVGGDRVDVTSLVGPNGDAHVFDPAPADAGRIADASIVVVNGLGLEGWLDRLIKASGTRARVVVATQGVQPIDSTESERHGDHARRHADPHAWQSVANARLYVANIRDGLTGVDPDGRETYAANATRYLAELDALERDVTAAIARIPPERRRIITTHDAFGYFAHAYGVTFIAPQGVSTSSEASAKDVARIIRQIRAEKVPAVFLENVSDPRLMQRIAAESGARIGGKVFSDALSEPGGPAPTYLAMMRNNMRAFDAALAP